MSTAGDPAADEAARVVVGQLHAAGLTLATCESLTGGGIAARITSVPGASAVFRGALVTYASDLKATLAGVDSGWIAQHGVINQQTAVAMAVGARSRLGVDVAASCTGVAGPDPQDGEQPGTVWIAVAGPGPDEVRATQLRLAGDRASIRGATADAVLAQLQGIGGPP